MPFNRATRDFFLYQSGDGDGCIIQLGDNAFASQRSENIASGNREAKRYIARTTARIFNATGTKTASEVAHTRSEPAPWVQKQEYNPMKMLRVFQRVCFSGTYL